jgi:Acyltransferase family
MSAPPLDARPPKARNVGIDALRIGTTFLVVFHHTAITYGAIGGWYYKEIPTDGSLSSLLLVFFCTVNQAWFMGLFFLLAGYYTPNALQAKGPWRYMRDRLQRLGIPLLVYGFVFGLATIALAQTARGKPFADTLLRLWRHAEFEKGPLWFAWALLIFAVAAALWRALGGCQAQPDARRALPTNTALLAAALVTGIVAFALRLQWPVGKEVWGLQLGYFASYIVLFVAGCIAASPRWLEHWPEAQVRTWRCTAWIALPVLPIVALLGGRLLGIQGRPEGGWNIPALIYAFWEPFIAWGRDPGAAAALPAAVSRARASRRAAGPTCVRDLCHPSAGDRGGGAGLARRCGASIVQVRAEREHRLRPVLLAGRPAAARARRQSRAVNRAANTIAWLLVIGALALL